ncbi:hypothetical protein PORY_001179 [Pneumocystis oryctolagi]|uniref:Uncharacterized protein n=1 Tax=Pneumocystis oryctolagi TaxID=42067 RepID=A0ACB7CDG5_9ASCO|nr:hypothetical protein PORY_001179 [Pneumocystis oryctolagi]
MILKCKKYNFVFFQQIYLKFHRKFNVLAIETSCDDTSVLENDKKTNEIKIIYHKTERSLNENEKFGGIHPEISIISHQKKLSNILKEVFNEHIYEKRNINIIAATQGPGMVGSLSVGLNTAKGLSVALGVPFIGVHHMQAHSLTPRLVYNGKLPLFPYLSLLLSGGHTLLIRSKSILDHDILASTLDIAVGDMIDKCSRLLKVSWNGTMPGQALEIWSKSEDTSIYPESSWNLPIPLTKTPENMSNLAFSFSGLGSSIERIINGSRFSESQLKSLGRSLQITAFTHIADRLLLALNKINDPISGIVVSGGVARNSFLKTILQTSLNNSSYKHIPLFFPPIELCSDNAGIFPPRFANLFILAMIAWTAYEMYHFGYTSNLSVLPIRKWPIDKLLEMGEYVNCYTRIERLIFISQHCSPFNVEALEFAIKLSQSETLDTVLYENLVILLQKKIHDKVVLDTNWIINTNKNIRTTLLKMESELKKYKNNLIKESIRIGYNNLGDYYYLCRDLENSLKFYSEAFKYCTTSDHSIEISLNIIKIFLEQKKTQNVQSQLEKIQNMSSKNKFISKIQIISGLVHFDLENYKAAALEFCMIKNAENQEFNDIISINDMVIYATLCALSSFSRSELKQYIIDNMEFKRLLELEPHILEMVISFYLCNYSKCFGILNKLKNDFILDIYLSKNIDNILLYIRQRAYIFYLKPFSYVDLRKMAETFSFLLENIEKELIQLILESKIYAKIDNINKFLVIIESNQYDTIYKKIHKINDEYKNAIEFSLIHTNLIKEGLEVKSIHNPNTNS